MNQAFLRDPRLAALSAGTAPSSQRGGESLPKLSHRVIISSPPENAQQFLGHRSCGTVSQDARFLEEEGKTYLQ